MRTPTVSLADLLGRARAGDPEALGRLLASCRSYLVVLAQARLQGRLLAKADPSDLVQQTLLDAYRDFGGFRGGGEAEWLGWLRRILDRNAADLARHFATGKRRLGREVAWLPHPAGASSGADPVGPPAPVETPSACLLRRERELAVAEALLKLSDDHRRVVLLRNLERLPFDEVARRLGRSRPAAQMLWLRAVERLRGLLGGPESSAEG
jgi:RNA polymerase sigma-70 factor (ECF subfamily)